MVERAPGSRIHTARTRGTPETASSRRRFLQYGLTFIACLLIVNAFAGDRGLIEIRRVEREYRQVEGQLNVLRVENARLREEARRLREDPKAIEEAAREELGLMRPDEVLFIIKDVEGPNPHVARSR
jgi:cell division protein FtsB